MKLKLIINYVPNPNTIANIIDLRIYNLLRINTKRSCIMTEGYNFEYKNLTDKIKGKKYEKFIKLILFNEQIRMINKISGARNIYKFNSDTYYYYIRYTLKHQSRSIEME